MAVKRKLKEGHSLIWVTLPKEEKKLLRLAAARAGVPMSEFVRRLIYEAAQQEAKEQA